MGHRGAIAILGASESTLWTYLLMRNLTEYACPGEVWPVNPNRDVVYGMPCHHSVEALPGARSRSGDDQPRPTARASASTSGWPRR